MRATAGAVLLAKPTFPLDRIQPKVPNVLKTFFVDRRHHNGVGFRSVRKRFRLSFFAYDDQQSLPRLVKFSSRNGSRSKTTVSFRQNRPFRLGRIRPKVPRILRTFFPEKHHHDQAASRSGQRWSRSCPGCLRRPAILTSDIRSSFPSTPLYPHVQDRQLSLCVPAKHYISAVWAESGRKC